jgi:outer membrane protein assembly factor BamB
MAVRAGGKDDVTDSHVLWTSQEGSSYIPSPVLHEKHLYWVEDSGTAYCLDAGSGELVKRARVGSSAGGGGGGRGGRGFYASVVQAGDKLYAVSRRNGTFVISATPELESLAHNRLEDDSDFNASPAIADDELFLRSNRILYCIANTK